ncbi:MAG: divalent metal cation transporter [Chthoniobacterales bacterium]
MTQKARQSKFKKILQVLGPGLITGAADDDPSGIATYSQVGAQFGFGMLWTLLLTFPLMSTIQEISARIGRTTGRGIAGNMQLHYPHWISIPIVLLLLFANLFNLGADILAMGEVTNLLIGGPALLYAGIFTAVSLLLQVFVPYKNYASYLQWLTLSLFAYVGVIFVVHVPWMETLKGVFFPQISLNAGYLTALVAVLGTTISPYLFFWQAGMEVEDVKAKKGDKPLRTSPGQAPSQLLRIRFDTAIGMAASNIIAFFIVLTAAVTLHANGITHIDTAKQAADALKPVAGKFAFFLFSAGIIGTGLLALPVLAGSAAYAIGELFRWPTGMAKKPMKAKRFYGVIAGAMIGGLLCGLMGMDPIRALFWSAVINGVTAVPVMVLLMRMSGNKKIMGKFAISTRMAIVGWFATFVMGAAAIGLIFTFRH